MSAYIFTAKAAALKLAPKTAELLSPDLLRDHNPGPGDITYLDISGFGEEEARKAAVLLNRRCKGAPWGIVDPKGESPDPARYFFEGASDYIGPGVLKAGIDKKRLKAAAAWRNPAGERGVKNPAPEGGFLKKGIKFSSEKFPGWSSMPSGKVMPFFLLFVSLSGKTNLSSRLGEAAYVQLRKRFLGYLQQSLREADGLLWMETQTDCLFLIPPKAKTAAAAAAASLKILMGAPMITMEALGLAIPVDFVFALHYGKVAYKAPGKTGAVVSDAVNFVFHLGTKRAEAGRLTYSDELPGGAVPPALDDLFAGAGDFEGRGLRHSRRFIYP
jgi:hypothetical protein